MIENCLSIMTTEKTSFYTIKKHIKIPKEAYTAGSKGIEKKAGFAVVFGDITRRGALPEKVSFHIAEMTTIKIALNKIHKREEQRWVICKDSQNSI